jgi:outer membrane protein TolC
MGGSSDAHGESTPLASARWVAVACLLAVTATGPGCAEVPWRAEREAPASSAQVFSGDVPFVGEPAPATIDRSHEYSLVELVDLAQRSNPDTRQAWESARAAAARLGRAESVYLPWLTLIAAGGVLREPFPSPSGTFSATGPFVEPTLHVAWTLLDLSRFALVSETRARVLEANFAFTRKHQEVVFEVARAYFALDSSRAQLEAARATLTSAAVVEEAAQAKLDQGLATRPDLLLAREERTRAEFDMQAAMGAIRTAQGALAECVGVSPNPPLSVAVWRGPEPALLVRSIEEVMQATLAKRPDLKAQRAAVQALRADERSARGRFYPRLALEADTGYELWRYQASPGSSFTLSEPTLDAHVRLDWDVFRGFEDVERLHEAEAERASGEAALAAGSLRAQREAWTAYFDVKTAERKIEFARSLLASSEEAYAATLETYRRGLGSLIDLLTAQRDLASARSIAITSHAELLIAGAALTLSIGATEPGGP